MGMGKQNSRAFPGLFQGLNFFPILYNTTFKSALFQPEASKCKGALDFFDSYTGDKKPGLPHKLNRIEYELHLAL